MNMGACGWMHWKKAMCWRLLDLLLGARAAEWIRIKLRVPLFYGKYVEIPCNCKEINGCLR